MFQVPAERRQAYVQSHPELDAATQTRILEGKIAIGMTTEQVVASWGLTYDVNRSVGAWGVHEQWVYGYGRTSHYLYFENGRLTSWQD